MLTLAWKEAATPLVLVSWILATLLIHQGLRAIGPLKEHLPSSCQLFVIGILFGILFNIVVGWNLFLFPALFFLYLLPPVALEAGYSMPKRAFFDYLGIILLYAVVGTLMNTVVISALLYLFSPFYKTAIDPLSILLFAALISPTDPVSVLSVFEELHVNEQLYILVSGESLLNHAFGIGSSFHLSDVVMALIFFITVGTGVILLGALFAAATSFWTRVSFSSAPLIVLAVPYLCYLLAETHLSGMLATVSCGLWMARYVQGNLQERELSAVNTLMKTWAASSNMITFSVLGISAVSLYHNWDWVFISVTIGAIVVARFVAIFLLSFVVNKLKTEQIDWRHQLVLAYSGIRGPICYGLVQCLDDNHVKGKNIMVTTAVTVIFVTCLLQGVTIKPLLNALKVERKTIEKTNISEQRTDLTVGIEAIAGMRDMDSWQQKCLDFNERYIKPMLMKSSPGSSQAKETYSVMPADPASNSPVLQYPLE